MPMQDPSSQIASIPPQLLPEALGFSPQLLLDDIINIANNAVTDAVNGMEEFLQRWADDRAKREGGDWDSTGEVEQGLVAFQTLLEYHTDLAFDLFEAWSLRNIFAIPPDLPIVLPHQQGLDLTLKPEQEKQLMDEIESLRQKIQDQRKLRRTYMRAVHVSRNRRKDAERQLEHLLALRAPTLEVTEKIPSKLESLYQSVATLPELDSTTLASLNQVRVTDPGKRPWETNILGYFNWAVGQAVARTREAAVAEGRSSQVDSETQHAQGIGTADQLRAAVESMGNGDIHSEDVMEM